MAEHQSIEKDMKMAEHQSCEFQGKIYPNGGGVCIGDQCIQCYDGKWGPNKYEQEERQRNL